MGIPEFSAFVGVFSSRVLTSLSGLVVFYGLSLKIPELSLSTAFNVCFIVSGLVDCQTIWFSAILRHTFAAPSSVRRHRMSAACFVAILFFMAQCLISDFMESMTKTTGTASISNPNGSTGAIDQSGQQELLTGEATNFSLEDAVNLETLGVSGNFQPFPAPITNTVTSDKTTMHNQWTGLYPPWMMGPNQVDMFRNIMAQKQTMMRAITSLQVDQRSKKVKHSSELGAPLHNISDISDERG